jgi:CDP-paratose 2-epimerase
MGVALITGSAGLIGSEAVRFFSKKGLSVAGIDNNMRMVFFGEEASTEWSRKKLESEIPGYTHYNADIRDVRSMEDIFEKYGSDIRLVIHTAAQPSHDWAAKDPFTDFSVNANGTLNMLEMTRRHCPGAVFIFTSTNKVYGDTPNTLPLVEMETRWEVDESHPYFKDGIDESMSIDHSKHSLFGASKLAADVLVQEYGRYFDMKTACFRGGCLTGPGHSPTKLHGFLAYLMKCNMTGEHYTVFGYKGKQVRDNIHSFDLINAFWNFYQHPRRGEVYNMGGSRHSNCSMIEAIAMCEEITGKKMNYSYTENNRIGDHIWWVSDVGKFKSHYNDWDYKYDVKGILKDIYEHSMFSGQDGTNASDCI